MLVAAGDRMIRVIACCHVDNGFGLLVREGVLQKSARWSSKWSIQPRIQYLALEDHELKKAALWQTLDHDVFEALH